MMSRLSQEACSIGARVDNTRRRIRRGSVTATRGVRRGLFLPVTMKCVIGDGTKNRQPLRVFVERVDLRKSFVNVRHRSDERRAFHESSGSRLPVKRISPAIILVAAAAG